MTPARSFFSTVPRQLEHGTSAAHTPPCGFVLFASKLFMPGRKPSRTTSQYIILTQTLRTLFPCDWRKLSRSVQEATLLLGQPTILPHSTCGSRDVIGHVSMRQLICHFLLIVLWNQAFISNGFRDIQRQMIDVTLIRPLKKVKVIHFGTNRFLIYDFLQALNSNVCSRTHRLATILHVTDDRHNTVPIARPLVRSAKNQSKATFTLGRFSVAMQVACRFECMQTAWRRRRTAKRRRSVSSLHVKCGCTTKLPSDTPCHRTEQDDVRTWRTFRCL